MDTGNGAGEFALVEHNVIAEVVSARAAALAKMDQAIGLIRQGHADATEAEDIAGRAHGGTGFYLNERDKTDTYRRLFEGFDQPSGAVAGRNIPTNGAFSVADPRLGSGMGEKSVTLRVKPWNEPAPTVTGNSSVWDSGGFAVGDPRLAIEPRNGTLGVQAWDRPGATVTASLDVQAGPAAVQDPRKPGDAPVVIIAQDGTWHRPLTAWELAALQSLPLTVNGAPLVFHGSPTEWREAIGNMVPPRSAQAIAEVLLDTLLQELAGVTFSLGGGGGIWVNPDDRVGRALGWQA